MRFAIGVDDSVGRRVIGKVGDRGCRLPLVLVTVLERVLLEGPGGCHTAKEMNFPGFLEKP